MDKESTLDQIKALGVLAVLRSPSSEAALRTVEALVAGGVTGIEITYTTPSAAQVVHDLRLRFGASILLGMGTLTDAAQVEEARDAGAAFVVSPHTDAALAQAMVGSGLAVMCGALTPSEVWQAWRLGSDVVKLFPGSLGGPAYLQALRGPFPQIPMMPTGGVTAANVGDWFKAGAVAVGAGSELCPKDLVLSGRFDEITDRARLYAAAVAAARSL